LTDITIVDYNRQVFMKLATGACLIKHLWW